jgi:dTDP-4-amino-4,6-dideoxygalactose transaminase
MTDKPTSGGCQPFPHGLIYEGGAGSAVPQPSTNPFDVVRSFERALCDYTGAKYAVTTTSCTMALLLACACMKQRLWADTHPFDTIIIPKRTYISVPMSIIHAGYIPAFRDEDWLGSYQLQPLPVWDCARLFTSGMFVPNTMQCVSFHWSKTLGIQQGGAILHDNPYADEWLRRARFDGRREGVPPKADDFDLIGWHCYMAPETAAAGLMRIGLLPKHNPPLPNDDYPDLSTLSIFK